MKRQADKGPLLLDYGDSSESEYDEIGAAVAARLAKERGETEKEKEDQVKETTKKGEEKEEAGAPPLKKRAVVSPVPEEEEEEESSDDEVEVAGVGKFGSVRASNSVSKLPSALSALSNTKVQFKRSADEEKEAAMTQKGGGEDFRKRMHVPASSSSAASKAAEEQPTLSLPTISWHVPVAMISGGPGGMKASNQNAAAAAPKAKAPLPEKEKEKLTVKEKEKLKRMKGGQSSQHTWKSETFMQLRQQFD
uniref:Uncharacterized protein n=1 Tax=Chromera velia CCMP2878 TaxID=1169474 RepID=A0A0G4GP23_9ALVE|eukprot:Cvel_22697.t1-p1 / transcript=Cvel_22697.t1 / gene=Cvel_22697 / organism=Chromera_velia_CCMP2878 / gene_product=hypothetical protein / transcript_product=hypothetical protein / location=Cvel_scaffold2261:3806-4552(-) / protein_length=249 / sequence_SO=supercontig / SO=protein_coding / is_pseudo=false